MGVVWVIVIGEAKTMKTFKPAMIGIATGIGRSKCNHNSS